MKPVQTMRDLEAIRDRVQQVGRLSDSVFSVGPLSIGLDGVLSWIPGLGEVYSTAAGAYLIVQGARAGVPKTVLGVAGAMMLSRTAVSALPIAGPMAADLFTAHKWSAKLIAHAIERKIASGQNPANPTRRKPRGYGQAVGAL